MKQIWMFHPNLEQSRVNKALVEEAKKEGVVVRDMYTMYPDGKIDVNTEQKALEETDTIILQYPIYWYSSPALMKEWEDRVLEYGWAYATDKPALVNKTIEIAVSTGAVEEQYTKDGKAGLSLKEILAPMYATIRFLGAKTSGEPFVTYGSTNISDEVLVEQIVDYREWLGE